MDNRTDRGSRLAMVFAALGIAGVVFCLGAVGGDRAPAVGAVGLAAQQEHAEAAAQQAQPAAAGTTRITIAGYKYSPATLTVNAGDTVVWTNQDTAPHNVVVTSGPEKFASPNLQKGESYSYTFTKAGSYSYYCSIHPDMKASVTVAGGATTPAPTTTTMPGHPTATPPATTPPTGTPPAGGGDCVPKDALAPFVAHLKAAHLETSPLQQAQDAVAFDQYIKTHTVLIEQMLTPLLADQSLVSGVLDPFVAHLKAAHLETSPLQQAQDALAFDQYIKTHTVLIEQMLTPALDQATC